jgi:DNA-binding transcriptional LysR family regulator
MARMQDRFEDLRTFVAVAQARSFAAAALRLGVAKSAVSRRIQELEARLDAHLISRSTRSVNLTEAGRAFLERATAVLADLEAAEGLARQAAQEPVGALRILAPASFGRLHLMPLVCSFLEQHARLSIELSLDEGFVDLQAEGFDMAVRLGNLPDSTLSARRLGTIRRVACASPAYLRRFGTPLTPQDLAPHRGLAYSLAEPQQYWRFVDPRTGQEQRVQPHVRLTANSGEALCEAALAGAGITVLPTFIIHSHVAAGRLVPLLLPFEKPAIGLHAVFPSPRQVPAKARAFVEHLAARCSANPYWDRDVFSPA